MYNKVAFYIIYMAPALKNIIFFLIYEVLYLVRICGESTTIVVSFSDNALQVIITIH